MKHEINFDYRVTESNNEFVNHRITCQKLEKDKPLYQQLVDPQNT